MADASAPVRALIKATEGEGIALVLSDLLKGFQLGVFGADANPITASDQGANPCVSLAPTDALPLNFSESALPFAPGNR